MGIHHMAWRATLRQCWDTLRADIKPSHLLHPFLSEDDEQLVMAEERTHGTRKASELLLVRLLQTNGWYEDFLTSLKIAGADHLVELLKDTHTNLMLSLPMVKRVREKYLQAWSKVMKNKWVMFRSKVVPHTVLQYLTFLSEEEKEDILDVEEDIGLSSAADVLHNIIRDTQDPNCCKTLVTCLRQHDYAKLATTLCDELKNVLEGQDYEFIRAHAEALFPV